MYNASPSDTRPLARSSRRSPEADGGPARSGPPRLTLTIDPALVLRAGLTLMVVLVLASVAGQVLARIPGLSEELVDSYRQVADVNRESSVPTWFQSSCLLACSALLWTVGAASRRAGARRHYAWRLLSAAFLYLSVDEAVALHEGVNRPVREALGLDGVLYFAWVVVAVPAVLLLGLVLVPWLRDLPRRTRLAFLVSGAVYVTGTVGLELVGAVLWRGAGRDSLAYTVVTTAEETLEMTGMLLFLAAVAAYHQRHLLPAAAPGTPATAGIPGTAGTVPGGPADAEPLRSQG